MSDQRPAILVLGSRHTNADGGDVPWVVRHEAEVLELIERLARFEPTVVALEVLPEHEAGVQRMYERFLDDGVASAANEHIQIGFRLARRCGLDRVHGFDADWYLEFEGLQKIYPDQDEMFAAMAAYDEDSEAAGNRSDELVAADASVAEVYRFVNSEEYQTADYGHYVRIAEIGSASNTAGAEYTASWYLRNLRMYANLYRLAQPAERVFVLVGAGHAPILRHFIAAGRRFDLHDPLDYIDGATAPSSD